LNAPAVAEHLKCSGKTAKRDLTALKDAGKIEYVGSRRAGYYRLCTPPEPTR
jgi:DeoR/GlpR family transcriptional regulator of sugar metabolism